MRRIGGRQLLALALALSIGVMGGAVTGALTGEIGSGDPRDAGAAFADPLGLGVPMVNLDCTKESIIIVGSGDEDNDLFGSISDWSTKDVRYLSTADSCPTTYPATRNVPAKYVAYLPPIASSKLACETRMDSRHKGNAVTRLQAGNTDMVPCACVMDVATIPSIGLDAPPSTESGMWTYLAQHMLSQLGLLDLREVDTGQFDEATNAAAWELQTESAINPGPIDQDTWNVLRDEACKFYDF